MTSNTTKKPLEEYQNTNAVLTPNQLQEEDLWMEIPPHSVRKVVMNVRRMGRAKPLDFDLDDIEEDPWVEMPPLSIRDVVMNVEYMGLAKPLDFDLDDVL